MSTNPADQDDPEVARPPVDPGMTASIPGTPVRHPASASDDPFGAPAVHDDPFDIPLIRDDHAPALPYPLPLDFQLADDEDEEEDEPAGPSPVQRVISLLILVGLLVTIGFLIYLLLPVERPTCTSEVLFASRDALRAPALAGDDGWVASGEIRTLSRYGSEVASERYAWQQLDQEHWAQAWTSDRGSERLLHVDGTTWRRADDGSWTEATVSTGPPSEEILALFPRDASWLASRHDEDGLCTFIGTSEYDPEWSGRIEVVLADGFLPRTIETRTDELDRDEARSTAAWHISLQHAPVELEAPR